MAPRQNLQTFAIERRQADARGIPADVMMPRVMLVVSTVLMVLLGLVMVFSASTVEALYHDQGVFSYVGKQAIFALVGAAGAVVASRIPYQAWLGWPFWAVWGACMLLTLMVPFFGTNIYGATRWIYIAGFSLQPTEFLKIALIMASAKLLFEFQEGRYTIRNGAILLALVIVFPLLLMYITQSDMGSALVIAIGIIAVMWLGEVPLRIILVLLVGGVLVFAVGMVGYRRERLQIWLNPWSDPYDAGYQMIHSWYAFSEGGLFGVGLGNSREKFLYLPEAETDFIFSIIGEELGLIGTLGVMALFLVFLLAGLRIAHRAPDRFGTMLAGGLTVMLVFQAFLNMGCAIGTFPTTGKPLPFISSGGSSMISSLLIVGLILSVSKGSNVLSPYERRRNDLRVIRVERTEGYAGDRSYRSVSGDSTHASPAFTVYNPRRSASPIGLAGSTGALRSVYDGSPSAAGRSGRGYR